jgi:hypothetical protein
MTDHPQYAMWKARFDAEQLIERERAARQAERAAWRDTWQQAWVEYEAHWREGLVPSRLPPWWHLGAWVRLLLGKDRSWR